MFPLQTAFALRGFNELMQLAQARDNGGNQLPRDLADSTARLANSSSQIGKLLAMELQNANNGGQGGAPPRQNFPVGFAPVMQRAMMSSAPSPSVPPWLLRGGMASFGGLGVDPSIGYAPENRIPWFSSPDAWRGYVDSGYPVQMNPWARGW